MTTMELLEDVHRTAQVDPLAEIAEDVRIGPFAIVSGAVRIGPACRIEAHACLRGPLTIGAGNVVGPHAVLGADPQSIGFRGEPTRLEIGDGNVFGAFSTVHRGTAAGGGLTAIGDRNTFQTGAHVGHDARVGDGCTLGSHSAIQQRVRLGRLSLVLGTAATTKDVPPFFVLDGYNAVVGPNVEGMRRSGLGRAAIGAVRRAFQILHGEGLALSCALARIEADLGGSAEVREIVAFVRGSTLGINAARGVARQRYYS